MLPSQKGKFSLHFQTESEHTFKSAVGAERSGTAEGAV